MSLSFSLANLSLALFLSPFTPVSATYSPTHILSHSFLTLPWHLNLHHAHQTLSLVPSFHLFLPPSINRHLLPQHPLSLISLSAFYYVFHHHAYPSNPFSHSFSLSNFYSFPPYLSLSLYDPFSLRLTLPLLWSRNLQ